MSLLSSGRGRRGTRGSLPTERSLSTERSLNPERSLPERGGATRNPISPTWAQRDQLTSFQFQHRRLVRSLVVADPETTERPDRRLVISAIVGGVIGVLALAVMAVIGILSPGNSTRWKSGDSVIVEKETGTRYVLDDEGVLH
ncbi:MAG: secretion system protein eccB1, partial [Actinomycetota bacterium]